MKMSFLGEAYWRLYDFICGRHPDFRPWHYQWLYLRDAHEWQRERMLSFKGRVLDVGCGSKPYASWVRSDQVSEYIGLDVSAGDEVDIVISPEKDWPIQDASVDAVLATQVLEHFEDRDHVLGELKRVLKPGGTLLLTAPFLYPVHGPRDLPFDFARFTRDGVRSLFRRDYEIRELESTGAIGTALATLILTWIEVSLSGTRVANLLRGILLPAWIAFSFLVNMIGLVLDLADRSDTNYGNVCLLAVKR